MPQKNIAIAAGVVVLVLAIGAAVMYSKRPEAREATEYNEQPSMMNNAPASLKALVEAGTPVTCTFSDTTNDNQTSGTVYVANGNVRGDFNGMMNGKTMMSHMIVQDKTSFVWTSENKTGFKMMMNANAQSTSGTSQGIDPDKKMNYACNPWTADATRFVLPTDVTFTDMSAMMNGQGAMQEKGMGSPKNEPKAMGDLQPPQCSECNKLPAGSSRTQCIAALGCK